MLLEMCFLFLGVFWFPFFFSVAGEESGSPIQPDRVLGGDCDRSFLSHLRRDERECQMIPWQVGPRPGILSSFWLNGTVLSRNCESTFLCVVFVNLPPHLYSHRADKVPRVGVRLVRTCQICKYHTRRTTLVITLRNSAI